MFEFQTPAWLALLPVVLAYALWSRRAARGEEQGTPAITLTHPQLGPVLDSARTVKRKQPSVLWTPGALALLLIALAQPQSIGDWIPEAPQGRDIVLLLDTSVTMDIPDFELDGRPVTRLSVLKGIMRKFVEARHEDRFGVVVFGTTAATLVPPTFDHELVTASLDRIAAGIAGENTAIGDALGLALEQVDMSTRARPALILVTDGDNTAGALRPAEAVALARHQAVPVYAVQVGGEAASVGATTATEPTLRDIATLTGGRHYTAGNATALRDVIRDIDQLEQSVARAPTRRASTQWYLLPLLLAALLLTVARMSRLRSVA